ncbi:MAG: hypothetical protein LQ345_006115 [Seirophora villosa]|nr:MAG: hypothetical protein LQ345_006115 [Seirophora villosa]
MKLLLNSSFVNICIFLYFCQSRVTAFEPRQTSKETSTSATIKNASAARKVHIDTEIHLDQKAISQRTGEPVYGGHAQLLIDGTETEGPLMIELGFSPVRQPPSPSMQVRYVVRSKDLGVANTGKPIRPYPMEKVIRYTIVEGETSLTNAELFDHKAGRGLVADAWMENPVYEMGTGSRPNTCYDLLERILRRMNLDIDPLTKELFNNSTEYYTSYSRRMTQRVQDVASLAVKPFEYLDETNIRVFNVDFVENPDAPTLVFEQTRHAPRPQTLLAAVNQLNWEQTGPLGTNTS